MEQAGVRAARQPAMISAMSRPDHAAALSYAFGRLRAELPAHLCYHCAHHTIADVVPAARALAQLSGLPEADTRLIEVAAAFHDLGHIRTYEGHEDAGIAILREALPGFGFDAALIGRVQAMIDATRMPQSPHNPEQQILADADLDSLGRDDFLKTSIALWKELCARGDSVEWPQWLKRQIRFLRGHRYFTKVERARRDAGKLANLALLTRLYDDGVGPAEALSARTRPGWRE